MNLFCLFILFQQNSTFSPQASPLYSTTTSNIQNQDISIFTTQSTDSFLNEKSTEYYEADMLPEDTDLIFENSSTHYATPQLTRTELKSSLPQLPVTMINVESPSFSRQYSSYSATKDSPIVIEGSSTPIELHLDYLSSTENESMLESIWQSLLDALGLRGESQHVKSSLKQYMKGINLQPPITHDSVDLNSSQINVSDPNILYPFGQNKQNKSLATTKDGPQYSTRKESEALETIDLCDDECPLSGRVLVV